MKKPILLNTWEDFERELVTINEQAESLQKDGEQSRMEYPLYRGVSDSEYHLSSTLDRIQEGMSISLYLEIIKVVHGHVATCTGKKWDMETKVPLGIFDLLAYEFMAYLRHNGFPSPLIDWTRSPYIAAYFAFRDISSTTKNVSIFVHMGKRFHGQQPCICTLGPTITTDRKHFLQQSEYSICVKNQGEETYFATHEDVEEDVGEQDVLFKYIIPVSERTKVLRKLDSMNITAYSLFGSEPSLMETLALREIVFKMENR